MIYKIGLTGGPSSRKSSINAELEIAYEQRIILEAAEDIIAFHQKRGVEYPWEIPDFQDQILRLQIQRQRQVEHCEGRVFIDRPILDQLAYYQLQGRPYSEALKAALQDPTLACEKIFLIEVGNTCEKNSIRRENLEEAKRHQELHYKNYTNAGYNVEVIPFRESSKERADMIMRIMGEKWKQ